MSATVELMEQVLDLITSIYGLCCAPWNKLRTDYFFVVRHGRCVPRSSISFGGRFVFLFVVRSVVRLFAKPYTCTCDSVTPLSLQQARATLLQTPPKRGASRRESSCVYSTLGGNRTLQWEHKSGA